MSNIVYSRDKEFFSYDSVKEACEFLEPDASGCFTIWSGRKTIPKASDFFAGDVVGNLQETSYETFNDDLTEQFLARVTNDDEAELMSELKSTIDKWADKHHHHPEWYGVSHVTEMKIRFINDDHWYDLLEDGID